MGTIDYSTFLTLLVASYLGVIAHAFKESDKRNKARKEKGEGKYTIADYWNDEMNAIIMVLICALVLSYFSEAVKQIRELPVFWIGPFYFGLGYMGDSAFPSLLDLISKIVDRFKNMLGMGDNSGK